MGNKLFWDNLRFTRTAAQWTIVLSILGILKTLLWTQLGAGIGQWMIYFIPLLRIIPFLYLILFVIFRFQNSQYASVCFGRGLCHLIPILYWLCLGPFLSPENRLLFYFGTILHSLLSMALIVYVTNTERVGGGETVVSPVAPSETPWQDFFLMPKISFGAVLVIALAAFLLSTGSSSRVIQQNIGIAVFVSCVIGILVNGVGMLAFFLKQYPNKAFGCIFSSCGLAIVGFFGCISALSGMSFH